MLELFHPVNNNLAHAAYDSNTEYILIHNNKCLYIRRHCVCDGAYYQIKISFQLKTDLSLLAKKWNHEQQEHDEVKSHTHTPLFLIAYHKTG